MKIFPEEPQEVGCGSYAAGIPLREVQARPVLEQEHQQGVRIPPEPSTLDALLEAENRFDCFPFRDPQENLREIDSRIDGELEGSPEPAVDLHQFRAAVPLIHFELHTRSAVPLRVIEQ